LENASCEPKPWRLSYSVAWLMNTKCDWFSSKNIKKFKKFVKNIEKPIEK